MKKIIALLSLIYFLPLFSLADNHSITLGYMFTATDLAVYMREYDGEMRLATEPNLHGINIKYRYEWDSPFSVIGSVSFSDGSRKSIFKGEDGFYHDARLDIRQYSMLIGPAYRFNDCVSIYGLIGVNYSKMDVDLYSTEGIVVAIPGSSDSSSAFAYSLGVQIEPLQNFVVDVAYEGAHHSLNNLNQPLKLDSSSFVLGIGYRF